MYKGLKKKYSQVEYTKIALIKDEETCYFCLNNWKNYNIDYTNAMDVHAIDYFKSLCAKCIHHHSNWNHPHWHGDYFKTLYAWDNRAQGENNV